MTKGIPPPLEFFFECPRCGTYRVSEESARFCLTPSLQKKLDRELKNKAVGAKLKFKDQCPQCAPNSEYEITLVALTPRIN